jgi:hypothetical protein
VGYCVILACKASNSGIIGFNVTLITLMLFVKIPSDHEMPRTGKLLHLEFDGDEMVSAFHIVENTAEHAWMPSGSWVSAIF